jgi:hypothetical protein
MPKIKVVNLARIPCANSGLELSNLINRYSDKYESRYILGGEYSKDCNNIPFRAFPVDLDWKTQREECLKVIKEADIIHVHHDWFFKEIEHLIVGKTVIITLYNLCNSLQYKDDEFNRQYIAKMKKYATILTVADQPLQKKIFSDITTNTVPLVKMLFNENIDKNNLVPHIVFAPTNRDTCGVGKKMYKEVLLVINTLKKYYKFTFDLVEGVPYLENLNRKRKADIIIDDVDPEYEKLHNTSIEGACFGAVPLTNFSSKEYPFLKVDIGKLPQVLEDLILNPEILKKEQERIVKWREENYTPEKLLKVYEDLYDSKEEGQIEDLTVFLISCGKNPNFENCLEALKNQTIKFKIDIVKNYAPMAKAFQQMLDRCKTSYFVQVDEDMILQSNAIEIMYNMIKSTNKNESMVCFRLHDTHLDLEIQGVKIYKHDIFKKYPYNHGCLSCEMEQLKRMKEDGYDYLIKAKVLGEHSPLWTNELIFDRYFIFMQKQNLLSLPKTILEIYQKTPNELNLYAFLGAISGILLPNQMNKDKDFNVANPAFKKIEGYLNDKKDLAFLTKVKEDAIKKGELSFDEKIQFLNALNITFWYLKDTCLQVVVGIKQKDDIIQIGVASLEDKRKIEKNIQFKIDITIESDRKIKGWDMSNVPCPVIEYLTRYTGKSWKELKQP